VAAGDRFPAAARPLPASSSCGGCEGEGAAEWLLGTGPWAACPLDNARSVAPVPPVLLWGGGGAALSLAQSPGAPQVANDTVHDTRGLSAAAPGAPLPLHSFFQ